ncbi:methylated-DNA--protein-cysteine methyltransferase [Ambystoma mexicanum]|uniref:methylated-DNA--protein-cysteine methyltransferase n=1 Tax=Ambystoma mexicanum TaxID=8296 RepID=UPI0037E92064
MAQKSKSPMAACQEVHVALLSPLGPIQISGCTAGVHEVILQANAMPSPLGGTQPIECIVQAMPVDAPEPLKLCTAWLMAYFLEPCKVYELPLPPFHHPVFEKDTFTRQVLLALSGQVKFGDSVSYKQLASLVGKEKAVRAIGGAMRSNPVPLLIPCHRVVCSNGDLGAYMGGRGNHIKEWLLAREKLVQAEVRPSKDLGMQRA